jgi:hypothetical protein
VALSVSVIIFIPQNRSFMQFNVLSLYVPISAAQHPGLVICHITCINFGQPMNEVSFIPVCSNTWQLTSIFDRLVNAKTSIFRSLRLCHVRNTFQVLLCSEIGGSWIPIMFHLHFMLLHHTLASITHGTLDTGDTQGRGCIVKDIGADVSSRLATLRKPS